MLFHLIRERLQRRNNFSEEEAEKRLASQPMTNEERAARATVVVSNDGTEDELEKKVRWRFSSFFGGGLSFISVYSRMITALLPDRRVSVAAWTVDRMVRDYRDFLRIFPVENGHLLSTFLSAGACPCR